MLHISTILTNKISTNWNLILVRYFCAFFVPIKITFSSFPDKVQVQRALPSARAPIFMSGKGSPRHPNLNICERRVSHFALKTSPLETFALQSFYFIGVNELFSPFDVVPFLRIHTPHYLRQESGTFCMRSSAVNGRNHGT